MARGDVGLDETCLVVVGRGTSDSDANGNVAKVARMLWEGIGFAHAEIGYSGVAHPRTEVALERAARLGFRRIVVFPYFLFTGILVRRIYEAVEMVAARHPEIEFVKAHYLDDHPLVVETFVERIRGIGAGDVNMNCSLCKYRTQVLGFERDVGAPQESHHHHVEGIGTTTAIATTIITAITHAPSRPSPPRPCPGTATARAEAEPPGQCPTICATRMPSTRVPSP